MTCGSRLRIVSGDNRRGFEGAFPIQRSSFFRTWGAAANRQLILHARQHRGLSLSSTTNRPPTLRVRVLRLFSAPSLFSYLSSPCSPSKTARPFFRLCGRAAVGFRSRDIHILMKDEHGCTEMPFASHSLRNRIASISTRPNSSKSKTTGDPQRSISALT
jgi:hypothetical protein